MICNCCNHCTTTALFDPAGRRHSGVSVEAARAHKAVKQQDRMAGGLGAAGSRRVGLNLQTTTGCLSQEKLPYPHCQHRAQHEAHPQQHIIYTVPVLPVPPSDVPSHAHAYGCALALLCSAGSLPGKQVQNPLQPINRVVLTCSSCQVASHHTVHRLISLYMPVQGACRQAAAGSPAAKQQQQRHHH